MRNHRLVTLLLAAAIATASGLAVAPPAHAEDLIVAIYSTGSNQCLQPAGGSPGLGEAIVQEPSCRSNAQLWTVIPVSSTEVHLVNKSSGLCLDARGGAADGTPIQQWTCDGISNENWSWSYDPSDPEYPSSLVSRVSNTHSYCLATPGQQSGLAMQLQRCDGWSAQQWSHIAAP